MSDYKKMREEYKPKRIDVLFIGESPPKRKVTSGKLPHFYYPYFYNKEVDSKKETLYQKIRYALELSEKSKSEGLQDFKNRRMWLIDMFDEPKKKATIENVKACSERLVQEIKEASPRKIVTVLPKSRSNDVFLYFKNQFPEIKWLHTNPWSEDQEQFKDRLRKFLKDC